MRDQALLQTMRQLAQRHPRYGYRRRWAVLRRPGAMSEGQVNHKRIYRLWRLGQLTLPQRRPRKRRHAAVKAPWPQHASRPNHVWSYDFVHDACANGTKLKLLTMEDEYTRESLAIEVGGSLPARAVVRVLQQIINERGAPAFLRSDNGPECIAQEVQAWVQHAGIDTIYIEPGHPWQNAYTERFNGRLRDECLNLEWFRNRHEARVVLGAWRRYYNEERPHSSLKYRTPVEFRGAWETMHQQQQPNLIHGL